MEYTDTNRGIIQHRQRAAQIIDFSGIRYQKITPTDIDGMIEYHNDAFVFYEFKYGDAEVPAGQRLALERLVKDIRKGGKMAIAMICRHNQGDTCKDVIARDAIVSQYYCGAYWTTLRERITCKELTDQFLEVSEW